MYLGPIKMRGAPKEEVGGRRVFEKIRDEAERGLTGRGTRGRSKQEQKRGNVCSIKGKKVEKAERTFPAPADLLPRKLAGKFM